MSDENMDQKDRRECQTRIHPRTKNKSCCSLNAEHVRDRGLDERCKRHRWREKHFIVNIEEETRVYDLNHDNHEQK